MARVKKLQGNTLMETIVALSIAMLSFSIGGYLYSRYLNFNKQAIQQKAIYLIDQMIEDCYALHDFEENELDVGSLHIHKKVENTNSLYEIEFTIENSSRQTTYHKTIFVYAEI